MRGQGREVSSIEAGRLRFPLTLQNEVTVIGSKGQAKEEWQDELNIYADIRPLMGRIAEIAKQRQPLATHALTARHHPSIKPQKRFLYGERIFNILEVLNIDERNRHLEMLCAEVLDNGIPESE